MRDRGLDTGKRCDVQRGRGAALAGLALPVALLFAAPSWGAGPGKLELAARGTGPAVEWKREGFYRGHLLPGIARQVEAIRSVDAYRPAAREQDNFRRELTRVVEHQVERGIKRALGAWLLEVTSLESKAERARARGVRPSERSVRTSLGFSHGRPRIDVKSRSGAGSMRLTLELDGTASLEFAPATAARSRFAVRYEHRDERWLARVVLAF